MKKSIRLNIYVDDPFIRRQVKTEAARQDVSVSEYCLKAITEKLDRGDETPPEESRLFKAIKKARLFQKKAFAGRRFSVSSAALIARARSERTRNSWTS